MAYWQLVEKVPHLIHMCVNIRIHRSVLNQEGWSKEKRYWFTGGNEPAYKAGSFNMY